MKKLLISLVNYYATHFNFPPKGFRVFYQLCKLFGIENTRFMKKLPTGIFISLNINDHIQRQIFWHNGYESREIKFISSLLHPGDNFIDAGANIGNHSLAIAKHISNSGSVIAFEPSPVIYQQLNSNIQLNNFKNIITVQTALSDKEHFASLYLSADENSGSSGLSPSDEYGGKNITIQTIAGDEWLNHHFNQKISGIKIDVEGHEMQVLQGLKNTIERNKPFLMIEVLGTTLARFGHQPRDIYEFLGAMNYSAWQLDKDNKPVPVVDHVQEGNSIFFLQENHVNSINANK